MATDFDARRESHDDLASAIRRIEEAPRGNWFRVFQHEANHLMKAHNGAEIKAALRQTWLRKNRTLEYTDMQFENIIAPAQRVNGSGAVDGEPPRASKNTVPPAGETNAGTVPRDEPSKQRDINDIHRQHGRNAVRGIFDNAEPTTPPNPNPAKPNKHATAIAAALAGIKTATTLQAMTFPLLKYIVPSLIVEGCVLLAGKPKAGKSWFSYDVALAVASGRFCLDDKKCEQGHVLYLALEDSDRRLQSRATKLLTTFAGIWPERFNFQTKWPRADEGGIEAIDTWCKTRPDARLVVIDVLARFRAPSTNKNAYEQDYAAVSQLQELAARRAITIIIVHHTRKSASEDPVEEISGTLGLGGGVDALLILKRKGLSGTLAGRGRDTEDKDLALQFSKDACRWTILGDAADVQRSEQRARVLVALEEAAAAGLSPREAASEVGLTNDNAKQLLRRMAKDGEIQKSGHGRYFHASVTLPVTLVTSVTLSPSKKSE